MIDPAIAQKLERIQDRQEEINHLLSASDIMEDQKKFQKLSKELATIKPISDCYQQYKTYQQEITDNNALLKNETDAEFKQAILEQQKHLTQQTKQQEQQLNLLLLPKDPNDEKNVFLEIRAGTGGEEAALFASDLMRMYLRYCEKQKWNANIISTQASDQSGYRLAILNIRGNQVYSQLKFESGTHRVQRVPQTESQGRIHTSACTVAVLPEIESIEHIDINPKDIRVDTYKSSGAGGQHVNKTDSAVRITYLPENISVECQEERSQHKNKAKALSLLASKLLDQRQKDIKDSHDLTRKQMVGSGDRSEKIRTYNFPQARVTDHRIKLTLHQLNEIINGELDLILIPLLKQEQIEKLAAAKNDELPTSH